MSAPPGLAARAAAADLLAGVLDRGASLADQAGPGGPLARLDPPDRARAQALVAGCLRHLGRIDALLASFLAKPPPGPARHALRLAVAELYLDEVPAHAAVDGAVRLVQRHPKARHLSGLVNAVARRAAEAGQARWDATPEAPLPAWLADRLRSTFGEAALTAITAAQRQVPPVDLTLAGPPGNWAARLGAELLPTGSLRLSGRLQVSALPGYEAGAWWVQDAAAALPAQLLGEVAGRRVLDLCAAPGGKTLQLAAAGAVVTALDISDKRLGRLRENLARTRLAADLVVADALAWSPERPFDAVLVDAPCSASGTIRRHPDIPWLRTGRELPGLTALQAALLARAWDWLTPGGRLVFCTCSLLPEEGEAQVARFLATTPSARQLPAEAPGMEPTWRDAQGGLRLRPDFWPGRGGMDGFYAALIEKG
ncbi:MAG: transcription antitermination factor NusB [Amaricoccus sp.]